MVLTDALDIVGIVLGCAFIVAVIVGFLIFLNWHEKLDEEYPWRRRTRRKRDQ